MLFISVALAFQLELVRHSLTGTHYRFVTPGGQINVTAPDDTTNSVAAGAPARQRARALAATQSVIT